MAGEKYRTRVGAVRPSHLMFTSGVGSLADLPNFSVLVKGLDDWRYDGAHGWQPLAEPRLLAAVQTFPYRKGEPEYLDFRQVKELRPAPWLAGLDQKPDGPAARVGVPTLPFPSWMRCTACNLLGPIDSKVFGFENDKPRKPHEARFLHESCGRKRNSRKKPLAVAARFVLACTAGHLDDFPYVEFVHRGVPCPEVSHPSMQMDDRGGNIGANVAIKCMNCNAERNIREWMGERNLERLPRCRGRHPHLSWFAEGGCDRQLYLIVVGASNQWFPQTLSALAVPQSGAKALDAKVEQHWKSIEKLTQDQFEWAREIIPAMRDFAKWSNEEVWAAAQRHRAKLKGGPDSIPEGYPDLRTPEWEAFSGETLPEPNDDFTVRRLDEVPAKLRGFYDDVVQAERLREVRTLIGFTRLDAPDPEDPDMVTRAPLTRSRPQWLPATEVRGEGIFLRLPEDLLRDWEARVADSDEMREHREAYVRFRKHRYSARLKGEFDAERGWPGPRFYALHTLSHLLIRTIALQCGYSSASLSERIYAGTPDDPRGGILIYTAVPDAEGTLGGLVSLAEPDRLVEITRGALSDARHCSSDPLCAERLPQAPADFLHGAACHVCLFVSETTCERGNRYLDRRFVVPVGEEPKLALFPELP